MKELKPCPLCKSKASDYKYFTNCSNDECSLSGIHIRHKQWNTRPIEDELQAENKQLSEENGRLKNRTSNKCIGCGTIIDINYCEKCRKDWES